MGWSNWIIIRGLGFLCICILASRTAAAQTVDEWLRQKATQRKYLLEQIIALKVYGLYLQKGYSLAKDGLNTIGRIKDGDLNLHSSYFNSLKTVNPKIKPYPRVADILKMQKKATALVTNIRNYGRKNNLLTNQDREYLEGVLIRFEQDCGRTLEELDAVLTNKIMEMKDDERIRCIDDLYAVTQSQWTFINSFTSDVVLLASAREQEQQDIENSRAWHGIKD